MVSIGGNSSNGNPLFVIKDFLRLSNVVRVEVLIDVTDEPIFVAEYIHIFQENKHTPFSVRVSSRPLWTSDLSIKQAHAVVWHVN
jgi:hypothetical protein